jgi:hypothetical protein
MAEKPDPPSQDPQLVELMERSDEIRRASTELIRRMKQLDRRIQKPEDRGVKD